MDMRDRILAETQRLTLELGVVPSLNAVAAAAEVSKGGLIHHFPTRASLVEGLALRAIDEITAAMELAAQTGTAATAWLRLSVPSEDDVGLFTAMAVAHRSLEHPDSPTARATTEAISRWEHLIAEEVGDPVLATIIRLVGDGLALNALAGTVTVSDSDLAAIDRRLIPRNADQ